MLDRARRCAAAKRSAATASPTRPRAVTERAQTPPPPQGGASNSPLLPEPAPDARPAQRAADHDVLRSTPRVAGPHSAARRAQSRRPIQRPRQCSASHKDLRVRVCRHRDAIPRRPCSQAPWCARPARERRRRAAIVRKTPPSLASVRETHPSGRPSCANPHPVALLALVLEVGGLALAAAYPHRRCHAQTRHRPGRAGNGSGARQGHGATGGQLARPGPSPSSRRRSSHREEGRRAARARGVSRVAEQ